MDTRQSLTARESSMSPKESLSIIRDYGEDQFAKNIAKHTMQAAKRAKSPMETGRTERTDKGGDTGEMSYGGQFLQTHLPGDPTNATMNLMF